MKQNRTKRLCAMAMLMAIMFLMGFTPLGSIPLPFMKATTTHIPVILAAILFGWKAGVCFGAGFGVISVLRSTMAPNVTSFAFSPFVPMPGQSTGSWKALIIAFVPRICIGLVVTLCMHLLGRRQNTRLGGFLCGIAGSLTNTILVLALIYLLLGRSYAAASGIAYEALLGLLGSVVLTNGIGEAVCAAVLTAALAPLLRKLLTRMQITDGKMK